MDHPITTMNARISRHRKDGGKPARTPREVWRFLDGSVREGYRGSGHGTIARRRAELARALQERYEEEAGRDVPRRRNLHTIWTGLGRIRRSK